VVDRELGRRYLETGDVDLHLAASELHLAAHRLPPKLAAILTALVAQMLPPVMTVEEQRYWLMRKFKNQGETHYRAAELAAEAAVGTPYSGASVPGMKDSFTKGKRLAEQREQRLQEELELLQELRELLRQPQPAICTK
jgi:hypothetical protein